MLDAVAIPSDERYINTVYFPDLGGPETMELGNAEVQLQIPANLLVERGAKGQLLLVRTSSTSIVSQLSEAPVYNNSNCRGQTSWDNQEKAWISSPPSSMSL